MKAWAAALEAEVLSWPQVTAKPMFGFLAVYRKGKIFAALPRTRTMNTPNSVAFKLESPSARIRQRIERDPRIHAAEFAQARWMTCEMSTDADLRQALYWLNQAYGSAGGA
jgi:alpha-beta hydrolase superfamily lysophospholipase